MRGLPAAPVSVVPPERFEETAPPMTQAARATRLRIVIPTLLLASALLALLLYQLTGRDYPFYGDEKELFDAANGISKTGLFSAFKYSDRRPYLYPLMLSLLPAQRDFIFAAQLLAFECAALYAFRFFRSYQPKNALWLTGFAIFLNPFTLLYLGYALTEIFSIAFIIAYAVLLVNACDRARRRTLYAFLAGAAFGCAAMVRPSNLFLAAAAPLLVLSEWLYRPVPMSLGRRIAASLGRLLAFVVGLCLLMAPQFSNNLRFHDSATPIVVSYAGQARFDADLVERSIKYATAISKKKKIAVAAIYADPYREARASQNVLVRTGARFAKWVTTLFALVDQDRPIPYNRDMFPWYRKLASVGSLAIFFAGLVGLLSQWLSALRQPGSPQERLGRLFDAQRLPATVFGALVMGCLLAFSRFHTEARYGLPALTLAGFFLPHAWAQWQASGKRGRLGLALLFAAWMALGMFLSLWIERDILI
jgi:hypothetical protein